MSGRNFPNQSTLAPENLTTLPHLSGSLTVRLPNSAGDPPSGVSPTSASRAFVLESPRTALISLLSLSTISAGVFLGAPMPYADSPRSLRRFRPRPEYRAGRRNALQLSPRE